MAQNALSRVTFPTRDSTPVLKSQTTFFQPPVDLKNMNLFQKTLASVGMVALTLASALAQNRELVVGSSATYRPFAYENPNKEIVG